MFHLNFFLKSFHALIITNPGLTELVVDGRVTCSIEEDDIHSIFQAVDRHFVQKYPFLTVTNTMLLGNKRQILQDLEKQGGNVINKFQMLHNKMETKIAKSDDTSSQCMDIDTFLKEGENKALLKDIYALVFSSEMKAKRYFYASGVIPDDAELAGCKIIMKPASGRAEKLIQAINNVLKREGDIQNIDPKIAISDESTTGGITTEEDTLEAAVKMMGAKWNEDSNTSEYKAMLAKGLTGDMLGKSLSTSIWNELPGSGTLIEYIEATVELLKIKEKFIGSENRRTKVGPYGAVTFLLARKSQFYRDGDRLRKRDN